MKVWQCSVCKYIHRGDAPPENCPVCGVDASRFVEIDEASIPEKTAQKKPVLEPASSSADNDSESKKPESDPILSGFEKIKNLLVKHHAHPVSVHTPNGLLPAAVFLWIIAWLFGYDLLAKAAFVNMIFVVISLPLVIFTGILEWTTKYNSAHTLIFKLKILAATITVVSCVINVIWYLIDPNILSSPKSWVFILISIIMLLAAGVAGHIGGKLVFKD